MCLKQFPILYMNSTFYNLASHQSVSINGFVGLKHQIKKIACEEKLAERSYLSTLRKALDKILQAYKPDHFNLDILTFFIAYCLTCLTVARTVTSSN